MSRVLPQPRTLDQRWYERLWDILVKTWHDNDSELVWSNSPQTLTNKTFGGTGGSATFDADGTLVLSDDATFFTDLQGSALRVKVQGTGVSVNEAENTVDFTTAADLNDYAYDNQQMPHSWKVGSDLHLHIHWEQTQANVPNWLFRYRWQTQGAAKTTTWSDYLVPNLAFTYVSGTLNQISYGAGITPPEGAGLSDVLEIRLYRDTGNDSTLFAGADPMTATARFTFVDVHLENDTLGSRTEYAK